MRLAILPYINAYPLVEKLGHLGLLHTPIPSLPSKVCSLLRSRRSDAGLVPVADFLEHGDQLQMLGSLGICSTGPVQSVLLQCHCPLTQVRTIRLDPASRSSNALVRVLCRHFWKIERQIQWITAPQAADAEVIIGDRAFAHPQTPLTYDLAEHWRLHTGLPFVFAVWACRKDTAHQAELEGLIHQAYQLGQKSMPELIHKASLYSGIHPERCRQYLTESLHYEMGSRELQAMTLFHQLRCNPSDRRIGHLAEKSSTGYTHDQGLSRVVN